ncbi:glycosyltransferase [Haliscomenobacter sp.]|uniref:glycosyltransferase n=1 Tax=Haliscomenobacter sp. TaxID=2717303 RepID=UPI003BA8B8B4
MRVLHVIDGFGAGGAETWLVKAVKYLKENQQLNVSFDFLCTGGVKRVFDEEVIALGSKIFYVKFSRSTVFKFTKTVREILAANQYDAVHHHQDFVSGWHFLLGLGLLPKIRISHLHNPYNFVRNYIVSNSRCVSYILGRFFSYILSTKITGTSESVMREYGLHKWPYSVKKIQPIYCGFDSKNFFFDKECKQNVCEEMEWKDFKQIKIALFIGRIGLQDYDSAKNQKNPEFAFQIAKELILSDKSWKFLFVGYKGKTANIFEQELRELGIDQDIKFLGLRKDIPSLLSSSDVLVFPSFWEGLGMVAVEAQANGLNVLMSEGVPQEAIVCEDLVKVKKLEDGVIEWVYEIKSTPSHDSERRASYCNKIELSPFSIQNSVRRMIQNYQ